ncbi:zinc ribbon domain-containing protein [Raoultella planticola]|uniref:zinc ribbon domain-containing protein n=1 Tax=Raoultella planticola TaxID=575 RepID=UPI002F2C2500
MKIIGYIAIAIGIIFAVSALFMDVSVATVSGYRVNNLGLMSTRQNFMMLGGFIAIAGLIIAIFSDRMKPSSAITKCPYCAEEISTHAIKCKHCGSDVTPTSLNNSFENAGKDSQNDDGRERLSGVNIKYILSAVIIVFILIISTILIYRQ